MKRILLTICSLLLLHTLVGQSAIGSFSAHIPLHSFFSVAASEDYIYAAANNGLMLLEKSSINNTPELSSWTKVEGLSDVDINKIAYDETTKTLVISYINGNLDFVKENRLFNIRTIKDRQINSSKELSQIHFADGKAYLVYPFGIVIINIEELLIEDTWFTMSGSNSYNSYDLAITDNYYAISTDAGIFTISKSYINPANFTEWQLMAGTQGMGFHQLCYFAGTLFAAQKNESVEGNDDVLYTCIDNTWSPVLFPFQLIRSLTTNGNEMVVCDWNKAVVFNRDMQEVFTASWFQSSSLYPQAFQAVLDDDNIWVADEVYGLVRCNRSFFFQRYYTKSGPYSNNIIKMDCLNGILVSVPGSYYGSSFAKRYLPASISWYSHQDWHSNTTDFTNFTEGMTVCDLVNVKINPQNENEWYVASWGEGLFKCEGQRPVTHYHAQNSPLETPKDLTFTLVSGLDFDSKGNLWMTNSQAEKMLKMLEPNGTWHEYNITNGVLASSSQGVIAKDVLVDSRGIKWVTFPRGSSVNRYNLIAFNENGTYDNPGDDNFARVDMNIAAEVTSTVVNCIAEDLDGEIWIGTDKGIKVIYYPNNIFKGTANPRNILLEQDGYVSVLFEYEEISAIAVDGANRKWIGTTKAGVFLMSEDGQTELLHFTKDNSPLFSDQITEICIDEISGEVFFGTDKGIVSYRGDAISGFESYQDTIFVYPNPVRHDYTGTVAIRGLKEHSLCKITDSMGRLIWQGYSNGGQFTWNCLDFFGRRPATGVYYVMISDQNGKEKVVGKFLFIN